MESLEAVSVEMDNVVSTIGSVRRYEESAMRQSLPRYVFCRAPLYVAIVCFSALVGCSPTVKVEAPQEPITINMNIKIDHEVRVKIDRELDSVLTKNSELF